MNKPEEPLTEEQEAQLAFCLGRSARPASLEAEELRELVLRVRRNALSQSHTPNPVQVEQIRAAARWAAGKPSFVSQLEGSLRKSALLRLIAASLVIHLAALPVLAWLHFKQPEQRALWIRFEQPAPILTSEPQPELLAPIEMPELLELIEPELTEAPLKKNE